MNLRFLNDLFNRNAVEKAILGAISQPQHILKARARGADSAKNYEFRSSND